MMSILVIDVGGTHIKLLATGRKEPIKIPSGPEMTAGRMVKVVRSAVAGWKYEAVSIGYPGPVLWEAGQRAEESGRRVGRV